MDHLIAPYPAGADDGFKVRCTDTLPTPRTLKRLVSMPIALTSQGSLTDEAPCLKRKVPSRAVTVPTVRRVTTT